MLKIQSHDLTEKLRRLMTPLWCPAESGGIYVAPTGDNEAERFESCEILFSYFPEIDRTNDDKWYYLADRVFAIVEYFFSAYQLAPGVYTIPNNLRLLVENGEATLDMSGRSLTTIPLDKIINFTVTADHIMLIGHMNTRILDNCVEIMDFKRPYGDCTYYFLDMADALNEPISENSEGTISFSPEVQERYYQLHTEMLFAIQAFWTHATRSER